MLDRTLESIFLIIIFHRTCVTTWTISLQKEVMKYYFSEFKMNFPSNKSIKKVCYSCYVFQELPIHRLEIFLNVYVGTYSYFSIFFFSNLSMRMKLILFMHGQIFSIHFEWPRKFDAQENKFYSIQPFV